jgi:glutamate-1-semialdehyde 2,1-aminomutase
MSGTEPAPARVAALAREEARFLAGGPRSAALLARARRHMPQGAPISWMAPLHRHPPIFVERGAGACFTDVDGRRYLDMNQADLSINGGYAPPAVSYPMTEAVDFYLDRFDGFVAEIVG